MTEQPRKVVVLLSGGLDSTTGLAIASAAGYETYALTFSYGQRHSWELECARAVASALGAKEHRVASIDLRAIGGSALTADLVFPRGALQTKCPRAFQLRMCRRETLSFFPSLLRGPRFLNAVTSSSA